MALKTTTPELRAALDRLAEAERLVKEAEREQRARDAVAARVAAKSGTAYVGIVMDLYDELGVAAEHPRVRHGKGGEVTEVSTDPGDELRLSRLRAMLSRIVEAADPALLADLRRDDAEGRDRRRDEREAARRKPAKVEVCDEHETEADEPEEGAVASWTAEPPYTG